MNRQFYFIILFVFGSGFAFSQGQFTRVGVIPFYHGSKQLKSPFTGGLNAPIVNHMDLNKDGKKDLVLIHNNSFKISTYLNQGGREYKYAPRFETYFPKRSGYFIIKDLNEDQMEDLVYMGSPYILFYKGTRLNDSTFGFAIMDTFISNSYDTTISPDYLTSMNNYLPIVEDIDKDGDIDILYINRSSHLVYHRNLKKEKGSTNPDKNEFWKYNKFWGQNAYSLNPLAFRENYFKNVERGLMNPSNGGGSTLRPRHDEFQMGWHLDANNDGLYDLVAYSENQRNGPLGINRGTSDSANLTTHDTFFPSYSQPIRKLMPVGFWLDADNDGKKDIISSFLIERDNDPNLPLSEKAFNDDVNCIAFYKNYGSKTSLQNFDSFGIEIDSFLSSENIDVGTRSAPMFYDYDGDSLMDILISNSFKRDSWDIANITYYRNIGDKKTPRYILQDKDLFKYRSKNKVDIRMAAGDLNNDGTKDLLIGSYVRSPFKEYTSNPNNPIDVDIYFQKYDPVAKKVLYLYDTINIEVENKFGQSNMCLYDLNKDGKLDLFTGDMYSMRYYENKGGLKPNFVLINPNIISYDSISNRQEEFHYYPAIRRDPVDNKDYLYFAYYLDYGKIGRSPIDSSRIYSLQHLKIDSKNIYSAFSLSYNRFPTIAFGDINSDTANELIIGNYAGGIQLYSFSDFGDIIDTQRMSVHDALVTSSNDEYNVYPNPFSHSIRLDFELSRPFLSLHLYSIEGRLVKLIEGYRKEETIDLSSLEDGLYFLKIVDKDLEIKTLKLHKNSSH